MDWVNSQEYSRVDTQKMLDAADALQSAINDMRSAIHNMDYYVEQIEKNDDRWSGDAFDKWDEQYTKTRNQLGEDIDKYDKFVEYIKERVEVYIKGATKAEQTATEMEQDVRALLNTLLEDTGGDATVGAIRRAHDTLSQED